MSRNIAMRKIVVASALATALLAAMPPGSGLALAQTAAAAQPAVSMNKFGLPDFGDLVESVGPAVVNISVATESRRPSPEMLSPDDPFYDFLRRFGVPFPGAPGQGERGPRISRGIGSGFIISEDGYVLTNAHVVSEGKVEVTVRLIDKREFKAEVIGTDTRTDIALLKIDAKGLPTVKTGDAEKSRVGEWVVAMGSPFGFDNTVTAGIISAKARRLQSENYVPFIQTDVAINPGNSGGPLFNLEGEVIGINSQIYSRSGGFMGISFAIPIDVALNIKNQLIEFGRVQRGKLGITIQTVDADLAQTFGLAEPTGALIARVEPDSAADKAGLKAGDVVLSVDGEKVGESSDLPRIIGDKRPDTAVKLEIWRDGTKQIVNARLDEMHSGSTALAPGLGRGDITDKLGLTGRSLTADETRQLGVSGGVMVEGATGAAAQFGIQPGDVILALNNQRVNNAAEFRSLVERAGQRFALLVQRGDSRIFVPIRIE